MLNSTVLSTRTYYRPLGNSPPVCLTQDLPPEQEADILCLGCGDARNVLFTCFADVSRRIDVTCCDTEPGILARNVLLYCMLADDKENLNVDSIWNIYYHWKLDRASADLLEKQTSKLLQVSSSIERWHESAYGSFIRFCDSRSLSLVRAYWRGFQLQNVSPAQKKLRQSQLQCAINKAKSHRDMRGSSPPDPRCESLIGAQAVSDLLEVSKQWWNCGTMLSAFKVTELNPALLFSPNDSLVLHHNLSPLLGFPLSTAYVPIATGSAFHIERRKDVSSARFLVNCAKSHFKEWAAAFRRAVENKSVIRVFCGDALAFGCTLHNCHLTGATSMNLFCDMWTCVPLTLCDTDYGNDKNAAPMSFDIVDTSNLADRLGLLNVIGVVSSLLKYSASSSFYATTLVQHDEDLSSQLPGFFGVDARTMSLLFGLVLPELFTNATESLEDCSTVDKFSKQKSRDTQPNEVRSRLRWKRLRGCAEPRIRVDTKALAKLLIQVHNEMFKDDEEEDDDEDDLLYFIFGSMFKPKSKRSVVSEHVTHTRASFAFFLNRLRATIVADWDGCFKYVLKKSWTSDSLACTMSDFVQDLLLNLHLFGVDNGKFSKPALSEMHNASLASVLPFSTAEDVPEQLCITVRVPKKKLGSLEPDETHAPAVVCCIEGKDRDGTPWISTFSTVKIAFGKWHAQTNKDSHPYIEEDTSQLSGASDMFVSFMAPTWMLLKSKSSIPTVTCEVMSNEEDEFFGKSPSDIFVRSKMMSKDVYITRYMPGMSALPTFARPNPEPASASTTVQFMYGESKINTVTQRFTLTSPAAKAKLADKFSPVSVELKSPLTAVISITESEKLKVDLPLPLSFSKPIVRVSRKSSYVEIESPLFDPLQEDASTFILPLVVGDGSVAPTLWTTTRLNLDSMPPVELNNTRAVSALTKHAALMFSNREHLIYECNKSEARTGLKNGLSRLFTQYVGAQAEIFKLEKADGGVQSLIFPSCLRLDLVNHTFVLDAAIIPITDEISSNESVKSLLQELASHKTCQIKVSEAENHAWNAALPAFVERCRSWKHAPDCEYISEDARSCICSCGVGKFPADDYLQEQAQKLPGLSYVIGRYASRAAIAPIFPVPFVEECRRKGEVNYNFSNKNGPRALKEKCAKCSKDVDGSWVCSRCKKVSYCSKTCLKAHYRKHKPHCKTG